MDNIDIKTTVKFILARYIKDHNMRNTPEREAILDLIYDTGELLTHNDVYDRMKDSFRVSQGTVYNTLNLLSKLGLVVKHVTGNDIRFQACFGQRDNMITVCTRCGRTSKFESQNVSFSLTNAQYRRFHPEQVVATIYGICSFCQSKETRAQRRKEREKNVNKDETVGVNE